MNNNNNSSIPEYARLPEPIDKDKITELYEFYAAHLSISEPEWEVVSFEIGNPDPVYAEYCEHDHATYFKEKRRIEFYVQPNLELALHEFMHHITTEKLGQLQVLIAPELDLRQRQLLERYIERLDPGVDLDDHIEQPIWGNTGLHSKTISNIN